MTARRQALPPRRGDPGAGGPALRLTDTTFRDGNQSLLGGTLRTEEIIPVAALMDGVGFFAMEAWGGATVETQVRMGEDPWEYLERVKAAAPRTPIQALVRGQNLVAHHNFADDVVELFIRHAAALGVDVFRVFDPLNDLRNMEAAIGAAKAAGKRVQGALCYATSPAHNLELWCSLAKGLAELGVDDIVVKDTSGLLSPQVTWELVTALKDVARRPIVVHSHCSSGMAPMAYMAAVEAGAEVVDTAMSPLAWGASQPATESVVAALAGGDYETGLDLELLAQVKDLLAPIRAAHAGDISPVADRVDSDILRYQIPGMMLEDVQRQLEQHEALGRLRDVLDEIPRVRWELGYPPLVTPIRHMIASQAVFNVIGGDRYTTVTQELKDYLQGLYGRPPVPADPDVRRLVLGREEPITIRPADLLEPQIEKGRAQVKRLGVEPTDGNVLIQLLFPALAAEYFERVRPVKKAKTGRKPEPEPDAASPQDEADPVVEESESGDPTTPAAGGTSEFDVEVQGEVFRVRVTGAGMSFAPGTSAPPSGAGKAAPSSQHAVLAPMQGLIVKIPVKVGDGVKLGDVVAVLEAMKMQNDIASTLAGKVKEVYVKEGDVVSPNQPLISIA